MAGDPRSNPVWMIVAAGRDKLHYTQKRLSGLFPVLQKADLVALKRKLPPRHAFCPFPYRPASFLLLNNWDLPATVPGGVFILFCANLKRSMSTLLVQYSCSRPAPYRLYITITVLRNSIQLKHTLVAAAAQTSDGSMRV